MQDERVPVRVDEEGHVADARVVLPDELDALRLELGSRGGDVRDAQRDPMAGTALELHALILRLPDGQRDVARLELRGLARVLRQPQHVAVERDGALDVPRRDVHEVDALDLHHGVVPSAYGA